MPKSKSRRLNAGLAAMACFVFLGLAASVQATQTDAPGLDTKQLKAGIAERVENMIARQQPNNENRQPVSGENIKVKKVEPVSIGVDGHELSLFAVKAGLTFPGGRTADDIMMVVDSSGRLQMEISEVNSGQSSFQSVKDRLNRQKIDPTLGEAFYSGSGEHELVIASSPFCPYCRKAFAYFKNHTDKLSEWRMIHAIYPGNMANNTAVWAIFDGKETVDPLELVSFAYTELEPPQTKESGRRSEAVITQFMERFPELKEKWGTAEQARYFLKGKYAEKAEKASQQASSDLGVQATPKVFIDGIPVTGWAPARYGDLLKIEENKNEETLYGQK